MKRRLLALLLAVLTLTMLTAAAFAADETELGAYNLTGGLKVVGVESDGGFYKDADTFELDCTKLTGAYSLVLLLDDNSGVPTSGNIQYIDQVTVTDGAAKFTLKPKALKEGTYYIFVSTTDKALDKVASFQYGTKPPYTPGDVNCDGDIDVFDVSALLGYLAKKRTLTADGLLAADVASPKGEIDVFDVSRILQYLVGKGKFE